MKKLNHIIITIILSVAIFNSYAQNLVPNPSFEIYSSCPNGPSQVNKATPWYDPTGTTSDYFNACAISDVNIPFVANGYGYQYAKTGSAFTGLFALNGFGDSGREYIQVQLISPLISDSCYFVEFYCNLDNKEGYSINKLGAFVSDTAIHSIGPGSLSVLHFTPQIVSNSFLKDTLNWMHVFGYYKAHGGENFLTIGNFKSFGSGDTLSTGVNGGYNGAYYFIDDVSIIKVPNCDTTTSVHEYANDFSFKLYPNPNSGSMTLEYQLDASDAATLEITDVTGKIMDRYELSSASDVLKLNEEGLKNGIYIYHIIVNGKIIKNDKLLIIK